MAIEEQPYTSPTPSMGHTPAAAEPHLDSGRTVPPNRGFDWMASGWRLFKRQAGIWILLALVFGAIIIGLSFVPLLGQFAVVLLMPVFTGGMMIGAQKVDRGEELELADLFAGFRRNTGQLILVGVIGMALTIVVALIVALISGAGAVLAIFGTGDPATAGAGALLSVLVMLALMIPINMALWFAPALVTLQNQPATRAVVESFRACLKNIVPFLLYGLVVFVLAIFATIPFGLGWLVLGPIIVASVYAAYRDIFFQT